jgi:hypothetical protein
LSDAFQLQGARILGIPVIITEQYPKGLGSTVQEIDLTGVKLVLPKTKFSMVLPEVEAALAEIPGVRSVVLFGVEVSSLLGSECTVCGKTQHPQKQSCL